MITRFHELYLLVVYDRWYNSGVYWSILESLWFDMYERKLLKEDVRQFNTTLFNLGFICNRNRVTDAGESYMREHGLDVEYALVTGDE